MRNSVISELVRHYPSFQPAVIFDVGANVGQSTEEFKNAYPRAIIHVFEPIRASFTELEKNYGALEQVRLHNLALGAVAGQPTMKSAGVSTANYILSGPSSGEVEQVRAVRGDDFCEEARVKSIGFLKIDTEGHDLNVLIGFSKMLSLRAITMVQAEVSVSRDNRRHVPLHDIMTFMSALGYKLFRIVDFHNVRRIRAPQLAGVDYADAIFLAPDA